MTQPIDAALAERLFAALSQQLAREGERFELVVIGGAALSALGLVSRTTADIDVVGLQAGALITPAEPLPEALRVARDRVGRDFGLSSDWLNAQAADVVRLGLPAGFAERMDSRDYPPALTVHFASRLDLIHFKLHAFADRGPGGKHEQDLRALGPTPDELVAAGRWAMTHDPSPGFRTVLGEALRALSVDDADLDR
jgi:hypothetical protein